MKQAYQRYVMQYPKPNEAARKAFHRDGTRWSYITNYPTRSGGIDGQIPPTENLVRGDAIFAYDIKNKYLKWIYHGNDIANIAICFGDGKIYLAENKISAAQKRNALQEKIDL